MTRKHLPRYAPLLLALSVAGLASAGDDPIELLQARQEIPEDELLDVGILVFDPGLPDDEYERLMLEENGIFTEVRKSEARYVPIRLKQTLEATGFWGAVRIVPESNVTDLTVRGTLVESSGKDLAVEIVATDATGRRWLREKYEREADPLAYAELDTPRDPFQSLYNEIANDLLEARRKRDTEDLVAIRRVSELKFAADLAPSAFESYLVEKKGRYRPVKLPAHGDPMIVRLSEIRARDHMFIDTLNEYYADLFGKMREPYESWRAFSYEEQVALEKLNREAKWEKILGVAAIVGGVVASTSRNRAGRAAGQVAVLGGAAAIMDGLDKSEQAKMHREGLRELAQSLEADIEPILMDVEGEVMRLSGSVETQYATWRQLLKRIFAAELGLPQDPNEPGGDPSER